MTIVPRIFVPKTGQENEYEAHYDIDDNFERAKCVCAPSQSQKPGVIQCTSSLMLHKDDISNLMNKAFGHIFVKVVDSGLHAHQHCFSKRTERYGQYDMTRYVLSWCDNNKTTIENLYENDRDKFWHIVHTIAHEKFFQSKPRNSHEPKAAIVTKGKHL